MSIFVAAFSRYLRLISGFDFAYISVVITDECPKKSRIYMRLTPLSRRRIAFPLVIDQPDDNLDNQSVTKVLVPFIQTAKNRRQIIFVTHNPNLAVVADSDQIIHVKIDKENDQLVEVEAGGIENDVINQAIVTILEGTMLSFKKRELKYIEE